MPAFSSVPPALSSLAPTSASTVSPAFSQPSASSASSYLPTSSALSQPASSTSSLPPHPSLNHNVLALRGNVTTKPTPGTSTTPSLISSTASPSSGPSSRKWLPGVIVAAVVVVVAAALLAFWLTFRRRRQRYEQARQHDPQLTPDQFRRRSHMSQAALAAEAERERRNIIRKSLISRSSGSLSYLGAAGEVAGLDQPVGADDEMEESYRGVPLYQRQPVPRPPLQSQPAQPTHQPDMEREFYESDRLQEYADLGAPPPAAATAPLVPAPLNVSPPVPAANLRDDYKEWAASLRRHTSRVADRHPSLAEVVEESESDQREPLVGDRNSNRPASPPIPPRSRLRPLSMVALPDVANVGFGSGVPPRQDSTASHTGGFMARQVHADPRNRGQPDAASPTSLYSVDFSQVGMGGRRNSAGR